MKRSLDALISRWQLIAHPEGGWYREVQRSGISVRRPDGAERSAITTVLFLLGAEDRAAAEAKNAGTMGRRRGRRRAMKAQ